MTVATKRTYKAMFILDTRGREESVEQLIEEIKKEIAAAGAEVLGAENLGRREFARKTDPQMPGGNYVEIMLAGPAGVVATVREHFRLNPAVYRILAQGD